MELFPTLKIGWLNGWVLLAIQLLIQGGLLLVFPKTVVARLFDRSGWSVKQRFFTVLGKLFALVCLVLIVLTPLKINAGGFIPGLVGFAAGLALLAASMLAFRATPPGQPVTRGVYRVSRHPQIVALFFIFLGICLATGSGAALLALLISRALQHFGILAEEEVCLKQYGEPYRAYLQRVPRYLLL